jgi:predicted nucleotidyltransferase
MGPETEQIADRIRTFVRQISPEYPVLTAWLFGSWAAGTQHEHSDVDIGIVVPDTVDKARRFEIYSKARDFDIDFEVVVIPERDFISEDPVIVHEMKTKGIRAA